MILKLLRAKRKLRKKEYKKPDELRKIQQKRLKKIVNNAYENVEYPLIMVLNVPAIERRDKVMHYLEAVGMADQSDKYPSQLSGGQKQRVAVARALVTDSKLVLADEPTANLDHASAFKVIEIMRQMQHNFKTTFIFSTHDPKIVKQAEIIYMLEDGMLVNKEIIDDQKR